MGKERRRTTLATSKQGNRTVAFSPGPTELCSDEQSMVFTSLRDYNKTSFNMDDHRLLSLDNSMRNQEDTITYEVRSLESR